MDTQMEKKISLTISEESIMLAKKAIQEMRLTGAVTVKCPKCGTIPKITISPRGERQTVRCKCGYIADGEIYF